MILKYIKKAIVSTFVYSGRSERLEHWAYLLFSGLWILGFIFATKYGWATIFPLNWIILMILIFLCLSNVSLMVRRLHDHGMSGFWLFVPAFPFSIMLLAAKSLYGTEASFLPQESADLLFKLSQGAMVTAITVFGSMFVRPGDKKSNKYGGPP